MTCHNCRIECRRFGKSQNRQRYHHHESNQDLAHHTPWSNGLGLPRESVRKSRGGRLPQLWAM